ncbi:glycerate kinase [Salipaludibacillus sp. CF4.18]|uniref:glycerate kinase n=1 Tax=Salipaludibacillus sp. CF4.18 TaxID=3373081 RepID=UPI003EE7E05D
MPCFISAKLEYDGRIITEAVGLETHVLGAGFVTGEGSINHHTVFGKTLICVEEVAKMYYVPVIVICGSISQDL